MSLFRIDSKILSTQKCYRVMLWALSMPGSLQKVDFEKNETDILSRVPRPVALMSRTLLDEQVPVAAFGNDSGLWLEEIIAATGACEAGVNKADYVIASSVLGLAEMRSVKQGTLLSPEDGATLIIWLDEEIEGTAGTVEISGPGIEDAASICVGSAMISLIKHRCAIEFEYPLGFDLFAVGSEGHLLGLPRTSSVKIVSNKGISGFANTPPFQHSVR